MNDECDWQDGYDPDSDTCCDWMLTALRHEAIKLLHGKKYALDFKDLCLVFNFCPFCGANLRSYRLSQGYKHL